MGGGGSLRQRLQPLEAEASRLHPSSAGAHRLLQAQVRGARSDENVKHDQIFAASSHETTSCFVQVWPSSTWTAFMYRHPQSQYAELGLGGKQGCLVVWLCGEEWTTSQYHFHRSQWYSICLTWSHATHRPDVYVDGRLAGEPRSLLCR